MASELALKISNLASVSATVLFDKKFRTEQLSVRQESGSSGNSVALSDSRPPDEPVLDLNVIRSKLNELTQSLNHELNFSIDESSGEVVVKVIDAQTAEVIRQIPSDAVLAVLQNIIDNKGGLLKEKA